MRKIPKKLIDEVSVVKHRVLAGESFSKALEDRNNVKTPHSIAREWLDLREAITSGEIQSTQGIHFFLESLKLEKRCTDSYLKKTLTPRIQIYVISLLLVLFNIFSFLQFNQEWKESITFCGIVVFLIFCSFYLGRIFLKKFEKILINLGWIQFLQKIQFCLQTGRSFPLAFQTALDLDNPHLSTKTKKILEKQFTAIAQGHDEDLKKYQILDLAEENQIQWQVILQHYLKGIPLLESVESFIENNTINFEEIIVEKSEKFSFLMLLPIFIFLLPAFFLSLLRPIWTVIAEF